MYEMNVSPTELYEMTDDQYITLIEQYNWIKRTENKKNSSNK